MNRVWRKISGKLCLLHISKRRNSRTKIRRWIYTYKRKYKGKTFLSLLSLHFYNGSGGMGGDGLRLIDLSSEMYIMLWKAFYYNDSILDWMRRKRNETKERRKYLAIPLFPNGFKLAVGWKMFSLRNDSDARGFFLSKHMRINFILTHIGIVVDENNFLDQMLRWSV